MPDRAALEQELVSLDAERLDLDRRIRNAVARQRHAHDPGEAAEAKAEEARWLNEMDRLMTRIRATEGRLLLEKQGVRRWS